MDSLTIGQVARQAGVGVETVRFYERRGILAPPPRSGSGYRQFPKETVARLRFVKRAKELGFTLKEICELLALRLDPESTCADVKARAEAKIIDVEEKIRSLQRIKKALAKVTKNCRAEQPSSECPILDALQR